MKYLHTLLFIVVLLLVGACSAESLTPPEPTAAVNAVDVSDVELPQSFSEVDLLGNTLTVMYPEGWAQGGNANSLTLTTNPALLSINRPERLAPGDMAILLSASSRAALGQIGADALSVTDVLTTTVSSFGIEASEAQPLTINGFNAAFVTREVEGEVSIVLVIEQADFYVIASGVGLADEREMLEPLLYAVAASVKYELSSES